MLDALFNFFGSYRAFRPHCYFPFPPSHPTALSIPKRVEYLLLRQDDGVIEKVNGQLTAIIDAEKIKNFKERFGVTSMNVAPDDTYEDCLKKFRPYQLGQRGDKFCTWVDRKMIPSFVQGIMDPNSKTFELRMVEEIESYPDGRRWVQVTVIKRSSFWKRKLFGDYSFDSYPLWL